VRASCVVLILVVSVSVGCASVAAVVLRTYCTSRTTIWITGQCLYALSAVCFVGGRSNGGITPLHVHSERHVIADDIIQHQCAEPSSKSLDGVVDQGDVPMRLRGLLRSKCSKLVFKSLPPILIIMMACMCKSRGALAHRVLCCDHAYPEVVCK
jgi:hypothetical protein